MAEERARPANRILRDMIQEKGRGAAKRRKFAANKENNWLLALTLHSFAKVADGADLSDLEQSIVSGFRKNGFTDEQLRAQGRLNKSMTKQLRDEIFTEPFAGLTVQRSYTFMDLRRDADAIVKAILAKPNVTQIDVRAVHDGRATLKDFPLASRGLLKETGSDMLVALEDDAGTGGDSSNRRYRIKATKFRCNDRATDSIFGPSNEPYWIFGSLGGGTAVTTRSRVFGDVDNGETRNFGTSEGCIWGQNCSPQDLPDGEIGSLVHLWEHDNGDPEEIKAGVAAAFAAAAAILAATGVAAWVAAVVAGVGAVVKWLLGFLDDDHISEQTFVFTRQVVENNLRKVGSSFEVNRRFVDGDADYTLTIAVTRVA